MTSNNIPYRYNAGYYGGSISNDRLSTERLPCQWAFAASIDCSGNILSVRNSGDVYGVTSSGWVNSTPINLPNPMPCSYLLNITGASGNHPKYIDDCLSFNGNYILGAIDENYNPLAGTYMCPAPVYNPLDAYNTVYYDIGQSNLCTSDRPFYLHDLVSRNGFYGLESQFFIAGLNPDSPTSGVRYPSNSTDNTKGGIIPYYWIRLSIFGQNDLYLNYEAIRLYFNTNIQYSGDYDFYSYYNPTVNRCYTFLWPETYMSGIYAREQTTCYQTKFNSGNVDFRNLSFSNLRPSQIKYNFYGTDYSTSNCYTCDLTNIRLSLSPYDSYTDTIYQSPYNGFTNNGLVINSGYLPAVAKVVINNVTSKKQSTYPNHRFCDCDCDITMNGTHYLKQINDSLNTAYYNKGFDVESVCCDCPNEPCITDIALTVSDISSPSFTDIELSILSNSGILAKFGYTNATPMPYLPYSFFQNLNLPLTYIDSRFTNECDFSGANVSLTLEQPNRIPCNHKDRGCQDITCSSGIIPNTVTVTIPNPYITCPLLMNNSIKGQTYILNLQDTGLGYCQWIYSYGTASSGYNIVLNAAGSYLGLSVQDIFWGFGTRTTSWSGVTMSSDCHGIDCNNISGQTLYPGTFFPVSYCFPGPIQAAAKGNITLS